MRISDWSSDVCSSDLPGRGEGKHAGTDVEIGRSVADRCRTSWRRSSPVACENGAMPRPSMLRRLERRLACHQALHDPAREPRNGLRWLPELRRWQEIGRAACGERVWQYV